MNKENKTFYEHCLLESRTIYTSLADYIANADFVYSDTCNGYLKQYNNIIMKYKSYFDIPMALFKFEDYEFSDSKKTIRDFGSKRLLTHIKAFNEFLEKSISDINSSDDIQNIAIHQMRKCLKTGVVGCPKKPNFKKSSFRRNAF